MNQTLLSVMAYVVMPVLAAVATLVALRLRRRALLSHDPINPVSVADLRARLREVLRATPRRPRLLTLASSSQLSIQVEARLLAGCPSQGLCDAEQEVMANPADPGGFVAMAKALVYCQQEEEARAALRWAQRLGADDPEFDYLRARLSRPDPQALHLCLRACQRDPGYAEALYLCASLCLKLGFESEGQRLMRDIEPLMHLSVERNAYQRDLISLLEADGHGGGRWRRLWRGRSEHDAAALDVPTDAPSETSAPV